MKYVSCDIETLGLDVSCNIIEFGAVLDDLLNPLEIENLPKFHCYIIQNKYVGEPYAMSMHSEILKRLAKKEEGYTYLYPKQLGAEFKKFLLNNGYSEKNNKITINLAGKNFMGFDNLFLKEHTDFHKYINIRSRVLDPAILYFKPNEDSTLPGLQTCLERASIKSTVKHTAIEDCLDVIQLLRLKLL
jgi:hypothetical protein